jgi:hypothetical protein
MIDPVEQLRHAVTDPGVNPAYHRRVMAAHRREWPLLWAAIDRLLEKPKDLSVLVAEKLRSEHVMDYGPAQHDGERTVKCSCGAHWVVPLSSIERSMKSHHISVGLKPSEVL